MTDEVRVLKTTVIYIEKRGQEFQKEGKLCAAA